MYGCLVTEARERRMKKMPHKYSYVKCINMLTSELNSIGENRDIPILKAENLNAGASWDTAALLRHMLALNPGDYNWKDYLLKDAVVNALSTILFQIYEEPNDLMAETYRVEGILSDAIKYNMYQYIGDLPGYEQALVVPYIIMNKSSYNLRGKFAEFLDKNDRGTSLRKRHHVHRPLTNKQLNAKKQKNVHPNKV